MLIFGLFIFFRKCKHDFYPNPLISKNKKKKISFIFKALRVSPAETRLTVYRRLRVRCVRWNPLEFRRCPHGACLLLCRHCADSYTLAAYWASVPSVPKAPSGIVLDKMELVDAALEEPALGRTVFVGPASSLRCPGFGQCKLRATANFKLARGATGSHWLLSALFQVARRQAADEATTRLPATAGFNFR